MAKPLDLGTFRAKYQVIMLPDGKRLKLLKPTEGVYIKLLDLKDIKGETLVEAVNELADIILNNNLEKIQVDIEELSLDMKYAVIERYSEFVEEVLADPNFKSPPSQK